MMKNFNADIVVVTVKNEINSPPNRFYKSEDGLDSGSDSKRWIITEKPVLQKTKPAATRLFQSPCPASGTVVVELQVRLEFSHFKPYSASKPLSW